MRKIGVNGECDDWAFHRQESGAAFFNGQQGASRQSLALALSM